MFKTRVKDTNICLQSYEIEGYDLVLNRIDSACQAWSIFIVYDKTLIS